MAAKESEAKPAEEGKAYQSWFLIVLTVIGGLFIFLQASIFTNPKFIFSMDYILFGLIGVIFHIASVYREKRETEGFQLKAYGGDYLFRAFQVVVYVLLLRNMLGVPELVEASESSQKFSGYDAPSLLRWGFGTIALLTGMFIRKVEKAFVSIGERFGDMLSGMLGASLDDPTNKDAKQRLVELQEQYLELRSQVLAPDLTMSDNDRSTFMKAFDSVKDLMLKGRLASAEKELSVLGFRMKEHAQDIAAATAATDAADSEAGK